MLNKISELELRLFSKLHHEGVLQRLIKATLGIVVTAVTMSEECCISFEEEMVTGNEQVTFNFERIKLLAVLPDKNKIRIEFTFRNKAFLMEDVVGEALKAFSNQAEPFLQRDMPILFEEMYPVYVVNLLDFIQNEAKNHPVSDIIIAEKDSQQRLKDENGNDLFRLMVIELAKFDSGDELVNQLLMDWRAFFQKK